VRGGCLRIGAKAPGVKRFVTCVALAMCFAITGCKDPTGATPATTSSFVRAATDIVIKNVRTVATNDSVAGANSQEYYVVTFTYTNDLGYALVPSIKHFTLEDVDRIRYLGEDSGSTALVGIENDSPLLKPGDSHEYTVGFRVPENTYATLQYDPTEE
jgi:hypothetical protein